VRGHSRTLAQTAVLAFALLQLFFLGWFQRDRAPRSGWNRTAGFPHADIRRPLSQTQELQQAGERTWLGIRFHAVRCCPKLSGLTLGHLPRMSPAAADGMHVGEVATLPANARSSQLEQSLGQTSVRLDFKNRCSIH
jgi:hypothetical protein